MKKYKFKINGNTYESEIINFEDNIAEIEVNGTTYTVEVDKMTKAPKTPKLVRPAAVPSTDSHPSVAKTSSPSAPKGAGSIKSPLPGVILDVFVREGDVVKMGQKLLMLEAMKMETEVRATASGEIVGVFVKAGDSVAVGDPLISLA